MNHDELNNLYKDYQIVKIEVWSNHKCFVAKGDMFLLVNDVGLIEKYKINFSEITIDLYTTKSWFTKKTNTFNVRKKLFKNLKIEEQIERPDKKAHKNLKLNQEQIKSFNYFINENYKGTPNGIIGILKGNNPTGKFAKPKKAELKTKFKNQEYDFILFISHFWDKKDVFNNIDEKWNYCQNEKQTILFEKYINSDDKLCEIFEIYNTEFTNINKKKKTNLNNKKKLIEDAKLKLKKYKKNLENIHEKVKVKREEYKKNIEKKYSCNSVKEKIFNKKWNGDYEKAHIKPVYMIINEIKKNFEQNNIIEKLYEQISSEGNFLPLDNNVHNDFDKHYVFWNENGEIVFNKNRKEKVRDESFYINFKKISEEALKERLPYIKWHLAWKENQYKKNFYKEIE